MSGQGAPVRSVLTPGPTTVSVDTTLDRALELLEAGGFRHLPVLSGTRVVGVLSERDVLRATGGLPSRVHAARGPAACEALPRTVGEVASRPAVTVGPEETLRAAAERLLVHGIRCLPVVEGEELLGIVTDRDLLSALRAEELGGTSAGDWMTPRPATLTWDATFGEALAASAGRGVRHLPLLQTGLLVGILSDRDLRRAAGRGWREDSPIMELVTREVTTATPDEPLSVCAARMLERRVGALPVVEGERLSGILTTSDVLRGWLAAS